MSDKRFTTQDFCSILINIIKQSFTKNSPQFSETEVANTFDIAATYIYVEKFTGRVGD